MLTNSGTQICWQRFWLAPSRINHNKKHSKLYASTRMEGCVNLLFYNFYDLNHNWQVLDSLLLYCVFWKKMLPRSATFFMPIVGPKVKAQTHIHLVTQTDTQESVLTQASQLYWFQPTVGGLVAAKCATTTTTWLPAAGPPLLAWIQCLYTTQGFVLPTDDGISLVCLCLFPSPVGWLVPSLRSAD